MLGCNLTKGHSVSLSMALERGPDFASHNAFPRDHHKSNIIPLDGPDWCAETSAQVSDPALNIKYALRRVVLKVLINDDDAVYRYAGPNVLQLRVKEILFWTP